MHGNMVFSRDSIFPTPQQSGCLCVCSVNGLFGGHLGGHLGFSAAILDLQKSTFRDTLIRPIHLKCYF